MPQTSEPEIDTIEMTHGWIKAGALMMLLAVVLTIFGPEGIGPFIDSQYRDNATQTTAESAPAGSELVVGRAKIMMDRQKSAACSLILIIGATGMGNYCRCPVFCSWPNFLTALKKKLSQNYAA